MTAIEHLLVLQEKENRILQLERELKDIPERKRIEEERLEELRREVEAGGQLMKERQATLNELDLEVASRQEQITKLRQQQMLLKTNQEFKAMETEIEGVEKKIGSIEDQQLEMMDEIEAITASLDTHRRNLAQEQESVSRDCLAWDERASELQNTLETMQVERDDAVKEVTNPELLTHYQRVHSRRENALVAVVDGVCGGCHMKLPPYVVHDIKKQVHDEETIVSCQYCGRLLYVG